MIPALARLFRLEPEEARHALGLGGMLFALTSSYTLAKTARDTLFLSSFPAELLPWVFLGVGALTAAGAALYSRGTRAWRSGDALEISAWSAAVVLAAFAWLGGPRPDWLPFAFYAWTNVYGLILMSQFWAYSNGISDPREAKRTFGLIGICGILGGMAGGAMAAPLAGAGGMPLVLAVAAALTSAMGPMIRGRIGRSDRREEDLPSREESRSPFRIPYLRWLSAAALCSVLVATLLDYQFKLALQRHDPSPQGLASFLGAFYFATNLASLAVHLFVTRRALQAMGAGWSGAVLPAGIGVGAAVTLATGAFAAVIATRLWDQVLRLSLNRAAVEMYFFPLAPGVRRRARAWIEAGLERIGDALAGALLIALGAVLGSGPAGVAAPVLLLVAAWAVAWWGVRRGYVAELGRHLRRTSLDVRTSRISLRESGMLDEMERLLASPYERLVLQGLDMLAETAPERLDGHLVGLLGHASAAVRARALTLGGRRALPEVCVRIPALLEDPDPGVRVEAMRLSCGAGGASPLDALEPYLAAPEHGLRSSAASCMAELTGPGEVGRLRERFERLLREGGEQAHVMVAEAIGHRSGDSSLHDLLEPLLRSRSGPVRTAAFASAGRLGLRSAVPALLGALGARPTQSAARAALELYGDRVVGTLGDYLADGTVALAVRREIPRVLGRIGTPAAVDALFRHEDGEDLRLDYRVLKAMNRIRDRHPRVVFPRERVTAGIARDARSYLFAFVHYRACPIGGTGSAERLLCIALNERMEQSLNRVFRRLALLYPPANMLAAHRGVTSAEPRARGSALEYLENQLAPDHAALVLPLVDDTGDERRLDLAASRHGFRPGGLVESLDEILRGDDPWLRACALYVAAARREHSLAGRVDENLAAADAWVRDTAQWARAALATG